MNIVDRLSRAQIASRDEWGMILVQPSLLQEAASCIATVDAIASSLLKDVSMGDLSFAEGAAELRRHLKMLPDQDAA